jgi:hypothetical protein
MLRGSTLPRPESIRDGCACANDSMSAHNAPAAQRAAFRKSVATMIDSPANTVIAALCWNGAKTAHASSKTGRDYA